MVCRAMRGEKHWEKVLWDRWVGRQRIQFECKGRNEAVVNGRASRGVRRGKGDSALKQGSRPAEYTKEESVGSENLAKA